MDWKYTVHTAYDVPDYNSIWTIVCAIRTTLGHIEDHYILLTALPCLPFPSEY